jgi:hypothetical protein
LNFTFRYIDDVISLNNSRFGDFVDRIYPIELEIKDTTDTDRSASYLDLHLEIDSEGWLRTKLYDKRDDFNFPIVNFPFMCCNIPAAHAHIVYISQWIRYSRDCGSYHDFLDRGWLLTRKPLNQGFLVVKMKSLLRKIWYSYHQDLVKQYRISVSIYQNHQTNPLPIHNMLYFSIVYYLLCAYWDIFSWYLLRYSWAHIVFYQSLYNRICRDPSHFVRWLLPAPMH